MQKRGAMTGTARKSLALLVAIVACIGLFSGVAMAAPGQTTAEGVSLGSYLSSSYSAKLFGNTTGSYWLYVDLLAGQQITADFTSVDTVGHINLIPLLFAVNGNSDVVAQGPARPPHSATTSQISYVAPSAGRYNILVTSSAPGTFIVTPRVKPSPGLGTPSTPTALYVNKLFTTSGTISKSAATVSMKVLYYRLVSGKWSLYKTLQPAWSGYTSTQTKYTVNTTLPYAGSWRIVASYPGNSTYASASAAKNVTLVKQNPALGVPTVPVIYHGKAFTTSGTIAKAAATGSMKVVYYRLVSGKWVLYRTLTPAWKAYTTSTSKYSVGTTLPSAGSWRIGASYPGNGTYNSAYTYINVTVK